MTPENPPWRVAWLPRAVAVLQELRQRAADFGGSSELARVVKALDERLRREPLSLGEVYRSRGGLSPSTSPSAGSWPLTSRSILSGNSSWCVTVAFCHNRAGKVPEARRPFLPRPPAGRLCRIRRPVGTGKI
jgi:hypothetical protein